MYCKRPKIIYTGVLLFLITALYGQDPHFSQFYNSSLYYNPATAGISRDFRFISSYRNLYTSVPGDLSTFYFSADYHWSKMNSGLGLLVLSDNEGLHRLRTQRVEMVYSFRPPLGEDRLLQGGLTLFSINMRDFKNTDFVFTDQLDPIHGVVQNSSYMGDEIEPVVYFDVNAGFVYRQNLGNQITPTVGFSVSHLNRPRISFLNNNSRLSRKYVLHTSVLSRFTVNNRDKWKRIFVFFNPGFVFEYQDPFRTFSFGSGFEVYPFRLGMWFRNQTFLTHFQQYNSIIMSAGVTIPVSLNHNLLIDYSYDSTVSRLEFTSGGAHEITLTYNISLPKRKGALPCYHEWWRAAKGMDYYTVKK